LPCDIGAFYPCRRKTANFEKGVMVLHELMQKARTLFHCAAALCLAAVLCGEVRAGAAEVTGRMLVPVGHTVGIKLFSKGILVVKIPEGGSPARACGLKTGDVILECGGVAVTSTEQFQSLLQKASDEQTELEISRGGKSVTLQVEPEANEKGVYCIGAWVRDSMAGIGTMTYYDPKTGEFGALGHGITDVDTALLMPFSNGAILPSTVKAVRRGEAGSAAELRGEFDLTETLGDLSANTACGVFGVMESREYVDGAALPVGAAKVGKAVIRSNVEGDDTKEYAIEILKVVEDAPDSRDLVLSITDPELIAKTGGIVQGMSGSPIVQNGKLVGAVTHVLVNDPTRGYGIFIENMLEAAK
jgi:stage IV sporulation protein B